MRKQTFILSIVSLLTLAGCQVQENSTSSRNLPSVDVNTTNSTPSSSPDTQSSTSASDSLDDKEGIDLLFGIFDKFLETRNYTIYQEGVSTQTYMENGYLCDYSEEYEQFYTNAKDYGFVVNPVQGIYDFKIDGIGSIVVDNLISTYKTSDYLYNEIINHAGDFATYCEDEEMWNVYDVDHKPVFSDDNKVKTMDDSSAEPELKNEDEDDRNAKAVFYSTDENVVILSCTLGGLNLFDDTTGEYNLSSIDMIKVRINQDNTLTILPTYQGFHPAIYDIKDIGTTTNAELSRYADAGDEELAIPPFGRSVKTGWTNIEKNYFIKNFGYEMPFPQGASFTFRTYSSSTFAAFTDDDCGDITESYIKQLTDAGFTLLVEEEGKETESSTTYYINKDETGEEQVRITIGYSNTNSRYEKGTFTANIHNYPYHL